MGMTRDAGGRLGIRKTLNVDHGADSRKNRPTTFVRMPSSFLRVRNAKVLDRGRQKDLETVAIGLQALSVVIPFLTYLKKRKR